MACRRNNTHQQIDAVAKGDKGKGKGKGIKGACWNCGQTGHRAQDCPYSKDKGKGKRSRKQSRSGEKEETDNDGPKPKRRKAEADINELRGQLLKLNAAKKRFGHPYQSTRCESPQCTRGI